MAVEVVMPKQGNTVESCLIAEWRVSPGDKVSKGDILCDIETDKATLEVESDQEGTLLALLYEEGEEVPVLKPMMILGEPGEDISAFIKKENPEASASEASNEVQVSSEPPKEAPAPAAPVERDPSEFLAASPRAKNAAAEKAVELGRLAGRGPQGRIMEQDVLDFASANPAVGSAARDSGVHSGAAGTGIGGRVRLGEDPGTRAPAASGASAQPSLPGQVNQVKPSGIRKVIASRMMDSLANTAQFTLSASAPASSMMAWRKSFKESREALGLQGITLGDMVAFAVSRVLPLFPELNGQFKEGIVYRHSDVNLGIAVDTPRGLMVPVIQQANQKSLKQISQETKTLAAACIEGNISPDNLQGGTFTISNLGAFGVESFTPVINAPEIAILGVCNIQMKPVLKKGETVFEPQMGFSMTIDHQVVDGAPAARFLKEYCGFLAQFELAAAL